MRFSPIIPPRRPLPGPRTEQSEPLAPTNEEKRLIARLLRRAGYRDSR